MLAIRYQKSIPRYLLVRSLGKYISNISTSPLSCLQLVEITPPKLPSSSWLRITPRLSGICGSDLAVIQAKGSFYLSPFLSFPFVLGHEVMGTVSELGADVQGINIGERVVIEPNISCQMREISPPCTECAQENYGSCQNVTSGVLAAGLQTGYCHSTGGGWSTSLVAHQDQVHPLPASLSDEEAVLIEPFSCAIHAVLKAKLQDEETVVVIGCGTIGLLTIAAIRALGYQCRIIAIAKYPHQANVAQTLGADQILHPNQSLYPQMSEVLNSNIFESYMGKPVILGGADCTFDCVASSHSIDDAMRFTRPQGRMVLVGMPGIPKNIDWTAMWHKELQILGAYTYGTETYQGEQIRTFTLAIQLMQKQNGILRNLITGCYPLPDYKQALQTAMNPGTSQSIKTLFAINASQ
jgi:threonine dehydrogenase-like Zn-dependent dehydrogenase